MKRTFIETEIFTKQWSAIGLGDEELRELQNEIMDNPKVGSVIPGTGRLRKMRFAFGNRGKSGGGRVCYVDYVVFETVYLMTVYAKNEKENLSRQERNHLKKLVDAIEQGLAERNTK